MSDQNSNTKFPNSQLREVNCGIRFPALLKITNRIKDFQSKIRNDLPIFETQNTPALSKQGYYIEETWWLFKSEDQNLTLKLKNNSIILSTNSYEQIYSIPKENINNLLKNRKASLRSPWIEKLGFKLGYCFNRIALPDYPPNHIENIITGKYLTIIEEKINEETT